MWVGGTCMSNSRDTDVVVIVIVVSYYYVEVVDVGLPRACASNRRGPADIRNPGRGGETT